MRNLAIFITVLAIVVLAIPSNGDETAYKKIIGSWEFSAPGAPQPYQQGTLTVKNAEQKLSGFFLVEGQKLTVSKIEFVNDSLKLEFEVESTPISLNMALKDGVLQGTTDTPNGLVTVTAKSSAKEVK